MPITQDNIKVKASQSLTDYDDGGGVMTGNEIVDGVVNNLFPDISRLDRVYGRVSLRKAFVHVDAANADTYYGAHVILTDPPDDPHVSTVIFDDDSYTSVRADARDRIENYVVKGPAYPGYLLGVQVQGARAITLLQRLELELPKIGDVLCLVQSGNQQYVRIVAVRDEVRTYSVLQNSQYVDIKRRWVQLTLASTLLYQFDGAEPNYSDKPGAALVYSTFVADAAKYYGVKRLATPITKGSYALQVDGIYAPLVPSAQVESAITNRSLNSQIAVMSNGDTVTMPVSMNITVGAKIYLGVPCARNSITVAGQGYTWQDDGKGNLVRNGVIEGAVDYSAGEIEFAVAASNGVYTVTYQPGITLNLVNKSEKTPVNLSNRGYNWIKTLGLKPVRGSIIVDYMVQGRWYRLIDNGVGILESIIPNTGSGVIDYDNGIITLICAALPDVDSHIIWMWSSPSTFAEQTITSYPKPFYFEVYLNDTPLPIKAGSVSFTYNGISVKDDGSGALVGMTGTIDYATGRLRIYPDTIPTDIHQIKIQNVAYNNYTTYNPISGLVSRGATISDTQIPLAGLKWVFDIQLPVQGVGNINLSATAHTTATGQIVLDGGQRWQNVKGATGTAIYSRRTESGYEHYALPTSSSSSTSFEVPSNVVIGSVSLTPPHVVMWDANAILNISNSAQHQNLYSRRTGSGYEHYAVPTESSSQGTVQLPLPDQAQVIRVKDAVSAAQSAQEASAVSMVAHLHITGGLIPTSAAVLQIGDKTLIVRDGIIYSQYNYNTGVGSIVGTIDADGNLVLTNGIATDSVANALVVKANKVYTGDDFVVLAAFRTASAPVRPGSFALTAQSLTGETIVASADINGNINSDYCQGDIDAERGVVEVRFGRWRSPISAYVNELWYNSAMDDVANDRTWQPYAVKADSIRYNCVVYSMVPLDASLIGLDPTRLPMDGRVPIYKDGDIIVVHNRKADIVQTLTAGQTISLSRSDVSSIEIYDSTGKFLPSAGNYTVNTNTGSVTISDTPTFTGYTPPWQIIHTREDMCLLNEVQINGYMTTVAPITHDYDTQDTYVSSACILGDIKARVWNVFHQQSWTSVWSDSRIGNDTTAKYNYYAYPIVITNKGAITERWAAIIQSSDGVNATFMVVGEKVGVVATGQSTTMDCAPINPATGTPFFVIKREGWGSGWAVNNVLRFNTDGGCVPLWVVRTTLQGPPTTINDCFTLQIRGDAD